MDRTDPPRVQKGSLKVKTAQCRLFDPTRLHQCTLWWALFVALVEITCYVIAAAVPVGGTAVLMNVDIAIAFFHVEAAFFEVAAAASFDGL